MTELQAPIGYRFKPSDEVIIQYYLIPKIEGKPLPSKHIYETGEIYGKESHDLENTFQQGKEWYKQFASYDENSDDSLYFFTKLTKKWDNGSRISRTAGDGTWTANNAGRPIYTDVSYTVKYRTYSFTDNSVTGHKRKKETVASDGNTFTWNMDEYSILKGEQKLDYAIVKIRRKRSNNGGSTSSSSKQASSSSKKVKSCNYEVINDALACQDGFEVHNTATEGQHYANTSYHPTLDNVAGFQYCQNSSISFGNVVPSPEYNHLQYQPYASPSTTKSSNNTGLPGFWLNNCVFNEQAAAFQGFSSKSVLQDDVLETQQQPQAWGDPMNKNIPNYYQGPPLPT
ncbi:NAC domain-containing protein 68-like [Papaver somniferum]|uniref:NAC domain-containing protein 68-like n=1 Tax=Papaver somniferum TaxID=3469 RepID=UPI000E6F66ED|nr:NAC domain-containing protein 68-like [Papaver somniferum]